MATREAKWRLEAFLYILIHDHLPIGQVEAICQKMREMEVGGLIVYPSTHIKRYAHELLEDLILESVAGEETQTRS